MHPFLWMYVMLDFICMGFTELRGTGSKQKSQNEKNRCLWNTNAPFPKVSRIGLTFDLLPNDLNINRGHLLIKDYKMYLPAKFEASGGKGSWNISCTRSGRPT